MFLFLHVHPWVCMFSVNRLPCSGHSLGLWIFSKLSGDETSHEDTPRAELTVWSPPGPRLLLSVGTVSYKFRRKGSSRWWGLWAPGHSLEALRSTALRLRYPAPPHSSGHPGLNIIQRAPCRLGRHTLPQAQALQMFCFWVIFTYSMQKQKTIVSSVSPASILRNLILNGPFSAIFSALVEARYTIIHFPES